MAVYLHDVTQRRGVQQALRRAHDELETRMRARTEELEEATERLGALNVQLQHDAFHNALTGLPNRALLLDRLSQAVAHNKRHKAQGFAVLFLDLDRFKVVNDSLGHAVGDVLLAALEQGTLEVAYRPIAAIATGKLVGFEALARWPHPRHGDLAPDEFIPLAEEVGLITQLDRFVLRRACTQVRAWQRQFPGLPPLTLSVNL